MLFKNVKHLSLANGQFYQLRKFAKYWTHEKKNHHLTLLDPQTSTLSFPQIQTAAPKTSTVKQY